MDRNSRGMNITYCIIVSLSVRRAWIEICGGACARRLALSSLSVRRAWIEIFSNTYHPHFHVSLSVRRAWIEMIYSGGVVSGSASLSVRRAWIEIATYSVV